MATIRELILNAQPAALRFLEAKLAGKETQAHADDFFQMVAADRYTSRSPLWLMCYRHVEKRNNDNQWGDSHDHANNLSSILCTQFLKSPASWIPAKGSIYTYFRINLDSRWKDLCKKIWKEKNGRVRDAQDSGGETVASLTLVAGRSDHGEAWEREAAVKVRNFVQNDLPEKLRIVAMECWFNGSDPKPQKQIAIEQGVAESTVTLWKTEAREAISDFVYSLSS